MEMVAAMIIQRLCVSLLVTLMFEQLIEGILIGEHERFMEDAAYTAQTPTQRIFFIIERGHWVQRIMLGLGACGLYTGIQFLTDDIMLIVALLAQ